ncbi:acylneuraminate cytidylyltransferase [Arthrobacter sp. Marseille-P9274]|uniref:acylneuraminate cytidylyltransferase n=1 Tax=Arthrobacter sp. Marseille-P9274 TaxID=2866572 RepID=UPI0021C7A1F8|nr:acylneuraminate cytidylyltransferase [Arthrobacter sp. Marseille-P9274]
MSNTHPHQVLVVIPARGGSKGIPFKNLKPVAGRSLVARAVEAARNAARVTDVVVSTDSPDIRFEAERFGARVIERPAELSGDTATSESAVLHALANTGTRPEVTVLMQCTSPFIDSADLDAAIASVLGGADVAFSVAENHNFLWARDAGGTVTAVGHSADFRPRRQDREPQYRETGAFYAMRTEGFLARGHRFFGRLEFQIVPAEHAIEIDSIEDLEIVRAMDSRPESTGIDVDALVMDFDGVHTDDHALVNFQGEEFVRVSRSDGMGVARLRRAGIPQLILSTETNPVVTARANKLGVDVVQDVSDKAAAVTEWITANGLDPERVAFVGNDVNDLPAMGRVGWPVAVADARPEVKAAARIVLQHNGGEGAVREICERVLAAQPAAQPAATAIQSR